MKHVHLRPITRDNLTECLRLQVDETQTAFVASNAKSLAQAYVHSTLTPLAIYDAAATGHEKPPVPMVGFTMYEVTAGVGFISRLMIGRPYQGQGYGRAAMQEVIRRLRLHPEVAVIATSHAPENETAARLYASLGFVPWDISWAQEQTEEVYLRLPDGA